MTGPTPTLRPLYGVPDRNAQSEMLNVAGQDIHPMNVLGPHKVTLMLRFLELLISQKSMSKNKILSWV